jgi:hypothetical protein
MNELIRRLRIEGDHRKNTSPNKESLMIFISSVKNSIRESEELKINEDTHDLLTSIEQFKPFDELSWIGKTLHRLMISRYRSDEYSNWNERGKYQYDFDALILKLDALLFRLENSDL